MRLRNPVSGLVVGAALLVGVPMASDAAETPALPPCASVPHRSVEVHLESPGHWSYDHYLVWCATDGTVEWTVPVVTHEVVSGSGCVWASNEETQRPDGKEVTGFAMGEFWCGTEDYEYPWSVLGVSPDGRSWVVDKGVDRSSAPRG
ncbi:hypothetical protein [Actinophytocola oryzae]|uniref:Secreted protein n=1 Tax=Actinophytocola oryzae TaxID=502181 RepID=A0A4R7W4Y8_9PSEU|nr:hypothetical protein [Actinophytocola oryzae]TDV57800.1 hypothetical protein CLV71_101673 [Actinophytocola oryzae]